MVGVGGSSPLAPTKVTREHPDESLGAFLLPDPDSDVLHSRYPLTMGDRI